LLQKVKFTSGNFYGAFVPELAYVKTHCFHEKTSNSAVQTRIPRLVSIPRQGHKFRGSARNSAVRGNSGP